MKKRVNDKRAKCRHVYDLYDSKCVKCGVFYKPALRALGRKGGKVTPSSDKEAGR
jgi:hypothetical protein